MFRSWHKSLGQYSVIESSRFLRSSKASFSFETTELEPMLVFSATAEYLRRAWGNLTTSKGLHFVELPDTLKPQIVASLKSSSDGHPLTLSNGKAALQRNGVSRQLSWTLQNETQAESMLIWHIATEYLIIALPDEEATGTGSSRHREVATKLSRYCAYLMSEAPELLPGNSVDTKFILDRAMLEAREALGSGSELRGRDRLRKVGTGTGSGRHDAEQAGPGRDERQDVHDQVGRHPRLDRDEADDRRRLEAAPAPRTSGTRSSVTVWSPPHSACSFLQLPRQAARSRGTRWRCAR